MGELIKCHRCTALYQSGRWWLVTYTRGDTSGRTDWSYPLDPSHCPICRAPPQLEPKPVVQTVM